MMARTITHGIVASCVLLHQNFVCPAPALTSSIVSLIAFGFPGKFIMSVLPLKPAVWRESTAVGTCLRIAEQSEEYLSERGLPRSLFQHKYHA